MFQRFFVLINIERLCQEIGPKVIMSTTEQIKAAYEAFIEENDKFVVKGNKAAAGRARKALMELAKLCKTRRAEILEEKK